MKKILIGLICIISLSCFSQTKIDFGLKAGINYNSNGDLIATSEFETFIEESRGKVGFHFGLWAKREFASSSFYIQPELLYTQTKSAYIKFDRVEYDLQKIEVPLLLGYKIFEIGHLFAGPDLQFIIDSNLDNASTIDTDSFSLALHIGVGINIESFGLDVRWEKGLSKTESSLFNNTITIDSRSNQLICSLSYCF
jgi:hypothetical protein